MSAMVLDIRICGARVARSGVECHPLDTAAAKCGIDSADVDAASRTLDVEFVTWNVAHRRCGVEFARVGAAPRTLDVEFARWNAAPARCSVDLANPDAECPGIDAALLKCDDESPHIDDASPSRRRPG